MHVVWHAYISTYLELGRLRQKSGKFETILSYLVRPSLSKPNHPNQKTLIMNNSERLDSH